MRGCMAQLTLGGHSSAISLSRWLRRPPVPQLAALTPQSTPAHAIIGARFTELVIAADAQQEGRHGGRAAQGRIIAIWLLFLACEGRLHAALRLALWPAC
eukprot:jgi/Ulvmu1/94/UM001_0097.1